jgi:inosose dehydratase
VTIDRTRIAGAPITWGVCEVPGWGLQLPAERVLRELAGIGLSAMELGPDGFLPRDPEATRALLDSYGLRLVAGFVPAVLHRPEVLEHEVAAVERQAATLAGAGAELLVLAAATGEQGYELTPDLDDDGWRHLAQALKRLEEVADAHGLTAVLHPHYGTLVERADQVDRLLAETTVGICLDIGHLLVGGADPLAVTQAALPRIRHVHLKDVDDALAAQVRAGALTYHHAVTSGLYRVLGQGDVDVATIVGRLEGAGYDGWYVLEQDTVLAVEPSGEGGPVDDAAASVRYLESLAVP